MIKFEEISRLVERVRDSRRIAKVVSSIKDAGD